MEMNNDKQLVIGMPSGSLADPKRGGNLISLLNQAGFKTSGYESGGPSSFKSTNFLYGWDGRPQEFGAQLGIGELDIAIAGDDWIEERLIEMELEFGTKIRLERVMGLQRGKVRLVGITPGNITEQTAEEFIRRLCNEKKLITMVSEMPYIALRWIRKILGDIGRLEDFNNFSVQKYKTPSRIETGVVIYETWGKTEAKIKNGGADLGVEITQSGSAIRNYGLKIIDEVFQSHTSIWINPEIQKDPIKNELMEMFLINLYGCINAEDKVLLFLNVPNNCVDNVEKYLSENNLFANEPTLTRGKDYTEYTIQVETENKSMPLAYIRYQLAKLGARNIDTVPLYSSIPSLNTLFSPE